MGTASIKRGEAFDLREFCRKHNITEVGFIKGRGAYFHAKSVGGEGRNQKVYKQYLEGMDPSSVDDNNCYCDWHDSSEIRFGKNNINVTFPAAWLDYVLDPTKSSSKMFSIRIQKKVVRLLRVDGVSLFAKR